MTYNIQCKPTWDRAIDRFLVLACIDKIVAAMKLKPALLAPLLMPLALLSAMLVLKMLECHRQTRERARLKPLLLLNLLNRTAET